MDSGIDSKGWKLGFEGQGQLDLKLGLPSEKYKVFKEGTKQELRVIELRFLMRFVGENQVSDLFIKTLSLRLLIFFTQKPSGESQFLAGKFKYFIKRLSIFGAKFKIRHSNSHVKVIFWRETLNISALILPFLR